MFVCVYFVSVFILCVFESGLSFVAENDRLALTLAASSLVWPKGKPLPDPLVLVLSEPIYLHTNGLQTAGSELAQEYKKKFPLTYEHLITKQQAFTTPCEQEMATTTLSGLVFRSTRLILFSLVASRWYVQDPLKQAPNKKDLDHLLKQAGLDHLSTEKN